MAAFHPMSFLSPQEQKILKGMAEGDSTKTMAIRWGITCKGVEFHRANIIKKLGTKQVAIICQFALLTGWAQWNPIAINLALDFGSSVSPADAMLDKIARALTQEKD